MDRRLFSQTILAGTMGAGMFPFAGHTAEADSIYSRWANGPSKDASYFPIGVWLQNPAKAPQYKDAGFNLYMGLWNGPTEEQLSELKLNEMPVMCGQNQTALRHLDDPTIVGWLQQDEPDNAQKVTDPDTGKSSYGPPVDPKKIIERYQRIHANDATRPVFMNLSQGVANDEWVGRGSGFDNDSYYEYAKGCDILSFDVYPVAGIRKSDGENYLWYQAKGLKRMHEWGRADKILWNFIECTHISNPNKKATPAQVKAQVWISLIHGSKGILYFVHQFQPSFDESALLNDPEMLAAVTKINWQIHELAPVLNAPSQNGFVRIEAPNPDAPVACIMKMHENRRYLFTVAMRNTETKAMLYPGESGPAKWKNIETGNELEIQPSGSELTYKPYEVKLFRQPVM